MTIPHFILINPKPEAPQTVLSKLRTRTAPPSLCDEWNKAIKQHLNDETMNKFSVYEGTLESLPALDLACDCIVSPANSYGIMDGG